jgi:hypothetical protein
MPDSMNKFSYSENFGVISFCGFEWEKLSKGDVHSSQYQFPLYEGFMKNKEIGEAYIDSDAFGILHANPNIYYKIISLIYELNNKGNKCSIKNNSVDPKNWREDTGFISFTVDSILKTFPKNFMEIQERALLNIYRAFPNYGERISEIHNYMVFAKDDREKWFLLDSLISKNILSGSIKGNGDGTFRQTSHFTITPEGWNEIEKSMHNVYSRQVFIAMRFSPEMHPVRKAIKKAIKDSGLEPAIVDEIEHINYIPIEILSSIKNSGYMVADLTTQNNGVYYEAGYASGLNIPVVLTCRKDEFRHFDISQVNTILWNDENELYTLLQKRLIALQNK